MTVKHGLAPLLDGLGSCTGARVPIIGGMNFDYMPELQWRFGYPIAIALMVAIDAYVFYQLRKAKWL